MPDSPAINRGNNALAVDTAGMPLETDRDGRPRIQGNTVDIGAYESAVLDWGTVRLNLRDKDGLKDLDWMDEWTGCWVEIWGRGDEAAGIGGFEVGVEFRRDCFVPVMEQVLPGEGVEGETFAATVNEVTGRLEIAGTLPGSDAGQDAEVLLAKVYFKPTPGESVLARDTDGKYLEPVADAGFQLAEAKLTQADMTTVCMPTIEQHNDVPLWPVMFDLNGDSVINLEDISEFVVVFGWETEAETASPAAWASDFDRSGRVDLADLSEMVARFGWQKNDGTSVIYPDYFPFLELTGGIAPVGTWTHLAGANDGGVTVLAGNWQNTDNEIIWTTDDFNDDGFVTGSDVTILAGNWQYSVPGYHSKNLTSTSASDVVFAEYDIDDIYAALLREGWNDTENAEKESVWQDETLLDLDLALFDDF